MIFKFIKLKKYFQFAVVENSKFKLKIVGGS
jgi:hypothetical protein